VQGIAPDMLELVGILHDVDRSNLAVLNLKGGRLQHAPTLDCDEARQAIDEAIAEKLRHRFRK
jgi:hypothetical protein